MTTDAIDAIDRPVAGVHLIDSLHSPSCYPHPVSQVSVVETHASWVILTGDHAYKIKKPVDLGFLDYSSLSKRLAACQEELQLNLLWAPNLYQGVVSITGSVDRPKMNGAGDAIEYAVHMREFPQDEQFDRLLIGGRLAARDIDEVASYVAAQHLAAKSVPGCRYGDAEEIHRPTMDNFSAMRPLLKNPALADSLEDWTVSEFFAVRRVMNERNARGWVRDCHGDLHLSNLAKYEDEIIAFDRIEFSEPFRWIDVISDTAFLCMDLLSHGRVDYGFRYLNKYLEITGDYAGVEVLRYYLVYRSLVRAKVALLRACQVADRGAHQESEEQAFRHLALAKSITARVGPRLILMHGVSGSGKTWLSEKLMMELPAIRLRSDVERMRLYGLDAWAESGSEPGGGLYDERVTRRCYESMLASAQLVLDAGWSAIIDATFLSRWQRSLFYEAASRHGIPLRIVACDAEVSLLQGRIAKRRQEGDASEANQEVLQRQLMIREGLDERERAICFCVDTSARVDIAELAAKCRGTEP